MQVISGVDEAGRGCVLGPMVMAICSIDKSKEDFFRKEGVKDSKLILKKKREQLFEIIKKEAVEYKISIVPAVELNILMDSYSLNEIEAIKTAEMIKSLDVETSKIILDSPDTSADKYKQRILNNLKKLEYSIDEKKIVSEHKADLNHICAGCASILAKVTRDSVLKNIIGSDLSGYSSDPKTIDYIKNYILENKKLPDCARTKWKTIDNIFQDLYQKKLGWFNGRK